jgi:GntR family transcriptional regulator/MocR family aminotransferase
MGWLPLRRAIADYLNAARGIAVTETQIAVTSGLAESVEIVVRARLSRGDTIAVEEPGYPLMVRALSGAGLVVKRVAVDEAGFDAGRIGRGVRAAVVTPSRHFPLGAVMPLARRLKLLEWSRSTGGILVEDDYDAEYRYQGAPLPALMSLEGEGRIFYLGSFSKVLSSTIRLGYLVAPGAAARGLRSAMEDIGGRASLVPQPALAAFMASGAFASHIRRMRRLYAARQAALVEAAGRHLAPWLLVAPEPAGMHLVAGQTPALARRMDDREASLRALRHGVHAPALSEYYGGTPRRQGLLLGYAGFTEAEIETAVRALARALQ